MQPDTEKDIVTIPTVTINDVNPILTDEYPIDAHENACDAGISVISKFIRLNTWNITC